MVGGEAETDETATCQHRPMRRAHFLSCLLGPNLLQGRSNTRQAQWLLSTSLRTVCRQQPQDAPCRRVTVRGSQQWGAQVGHCGAAMFSRCVLESALFSREGLD